MRLDLYLKQTSLIKRRTIAKQLIELGKVFINGKNAKPSSEVKENDVLTLLLGNRKLEVKVLFVTNGKRLVPSYEQINLEKLC